MNYDAIASEYDCRYKSAESIEENHKVKLLLNFFIHKDETVVDIGCGTGFCFECIKKPVEYVGYDCSQNMIDVAKNKFPDNRFVCGSMKDISETEVDVMTALFSIPYIDDGSLMETFNRLKHGGIFIAVYYNKPYLNRDSVYYDNYDEYVNEVEPKVDDFIVRLKGMGCVVEYGNLTDSRTYNYIVVKRR